MLPKRVSVYVSTQFPDEEVPVIVVEKEVVQGLNLKRVETSLTRTEIFEDLQTEEAQVAKTLTELKESLIPEANITKNPISVRCTYTGKRKRSESNTEGSFRNKLILLQLVLFHLVLIFN